MKRSVYLSILIVILLLINTISADLILQYEFEDSLGEKISSEKSFVPWTSNTNNPDPTYKNGKFGKGISLETNHFYEIDDSKFSTTNRDEISISFWADFSGDKILDSFIEKVEPTKGFRIRASESQASLWTGTGDSSHTITCKKDLTGFHHFLFTIKESTNTKEIIIDGESCASDSENKIVLASTNKLWIGSKDISGVLDRLQIYNTALTTSDFQCKDGIDNNNNNKIDALVETEGTSLYEENFESADALNNFRIVERGKCSYEVKDGVLDVSCGNNNDIIFLIKDFTADENTIINAEIDASTLSWSDANGPHVGFQFSESVISGTGYKLIGPSSHTGSNDPTKMRITKLKSSVWPGTELVKGKAIKRGTNHYITQIGPEELSFTIGEETISTKDSTHRNGLPFGFACGEAHCRFDNFTFRSNQGIPECSDGEDNNNDDKFDFCGEGGNTDPDTCDLGCASLIDSSEDIHDDGCFDIHDLIEGDPEIEELPLCTSDQTILKISSTSTALLWNDVNSNNRICYNQIFNEDNIDPDLRTCNEENIVIKINSETGLASTPKTNDDSLLEICYDHLSCRSVVDPDSCTADEKVVVKLSQESNGQIGNASSQFPVKICCRRDAVDFDKAYWSNPSQDIQINSIDLNSLVKLNVRGAEFAGKTLEFTIKRKESLLGFDFLKRDPIVASERGRESTTWRAGKINDTTLASGEYYFEVNIPNSNKKISTLDLTGTLEAYRYLSVSDTEANNPPVAKILTPENKQIYFIDTELNFSQASYDVDDNFTYVWELGDGTTMKGDSISFENYNFTYTYNGEENLGQKNIKLTVTDDRGLSSIDRVSILVINSVNEKYILSYIDTPVNGLSYGRRVNHDATSTYSITTETIEQNNECSKKITCIAGNCPNETKGCPTSESLGCNYDGVCPIPVENPVQPLDDITFCWNFDNGTSGEFCEDGLAGAKFSKSFTYIGMHTSLLNASINPSEIFQSNFDVFFSNDTCIVVEEENQENFPGLDLGKSYWKSSGAAPVDSRNACFRVDGINRNGDSQTKCCPNGYICNTDTGIGECVLEAKTSCQDFTTKLECEDIADSNIANSELALIVEEDFPGGCTDFNKEHGDFCYEYLDCGCEWNVTESLCQAVSNHKVGQVTLGEIRNWDFESLPEDIDSICNAKSSPTSLGECVFEFNYDGSCAAGSDFVTRSWIAIYNGPVGATNIDLDYCQDGSDTIACEQVVKLPFFNLANFIISALLIFAIYFIISRDKRLNK